MAKYQRQAILMQGSYGLESQEEKYQNFVGSGKVREFFLKNFMVRKSQGKILTKCEHFTEVISSCS